MSDLIRRKTVLDIIQKEIDFGTEYDADYALIDLKDVIAGLPTAYDVSKVVAELSEKSGTVRNMFGGSTRAIGLRTAIDIVKAGGKDE